MPIILKLILDTGLDRSPWKYPSVENDKAIKKSLSSTALNFISCI
jgi:hypothetical protein